MAKKQLTNELATEVIKFAHTITPLPVERETTGANNMVIWGDFNTYPNFLLELFKSVALHSSIVSSKTDYLTGDGLVDKATGKPLEIKIGYKDTAEVFANKVAFDFNLFGWFTVGVLYNIFGKAVAVYHIPAHHVRSNKSKSKFYVSDDWSRATEVLDYEAYKPGTNKDLKAKVYTYQAYVPSAQNVYPSIRYESGIINMVCERLINDFGKNNLEEGFSLTTILSFFKGLPDTEAGKLFTKKVKDAYTGVKGAKVIIDFNNTPTQQSPSTESKATNIDTPDFTAKLEGIHKINETNILTSHQAPSRALFGIEQAAGLNGNDLENAYSIFNRVWVRKNRNDLESGLNILFASIGWPEIAFKDSGSALPKNLSDTTKEKVYTIDELRAIDGLPPLANGEGNKIIEVKPAVSAPAGAFSLKPKGRILKDEDFELVAHLGTSRTDFNVLDEAEFHLHTAEDFRRAELAFDDAADIEKYILENDITDKSISEIRAAILKDLGLKVTTKELTDKIARLTEAGIIGEKAPEKKSLTRNVQILYEYNVRPGFGAAIIPGSRGFCRKLINNDRYYTREDIQQMSAIFGYDIFKHCGGWYYNPKTDEAENQCRHFWKQVRVIKKDK